MIIKLRTVLTIFLISTSYLCFVSCARVKEVSIHQNTHGCSIWVYRQTGKTHFIGRCGFFIKETSRFVIDLENCEGQIPYNLLKLTKNDKPVSLSGGSVEFLSSNRIKIDLLSNANEGENMIVINGNFKLTNY